MHPYCPSSLGGILYGHWVCHGVGHTRRICHHNALVVNSVYHEGYEIDFWEDNLTFLGDALLR